MTLSGSSDAHELEQENCRDLRVSHAGGKLQGAGKLTSSTTRRQDEPQILRDGGVQVLDLACILRRCTLDHPPEIERSDLAPRKLEDVGVDPLTEKVDEPLPDPTPLRRSARRIAAASRMQVDDDVSEEEDDEREEDEEESGQEEPASPSSRASTSRDSAVYQVPHPR